MTLTLTGVSRSREGLQAESQLRVAVVRPGQFGNLEEGERPPLEVATKQRIVEIVKD
jgi:hypothetical protein